MFKGELKHEHKLTCKNVEYMQISPSADFTWLLSIFIQKNIFLIRFRAPQSTTVLVYALPMKDRKGLAHCCLYIALFSALEQTHCTLVTCDSERWWWCGASCPRMSGWQCDSEWVTVASFSVFLTVSPEVAYLQLVTYLTFLPHVPTLFLVPLTK